MFLLLQLAALREVVDEKDRLLQSAANKPLVKAAPPKRRGALHRHIAAMECITLGHWLFRMAPTVWIYVEHTAPIDSVNGRSDAQSCCL